MPEQQWECPKCGHKATTLVTAKEVLHLCRKERMKTVRLVKKEAA